MAHESEYSARMAGTSPGDVTGLLTRWSDGDRSALDEPIPIVHQELRRLAQSYFRNERLDHTLQATALINKAFLRSRCHPLSPPSLRSRVGLRSTGSLRRLRVAGSRAGNPRIVDRGGGQFKRPASTDPVLGCTLEVLAIMGPNTLGLGLDLDDELHHCRVVRFGAKQTRNEGPASPGRGGASSHLAGMGHVGRSQSRCPCSLGSEPQKSELR